MPHEVSCLDVSPVGEGKGRSEWVCVGLWTDISVRVLRLDGGLEEVECFELGGGEYFDSVLCAGERNVLTSCSESEIIPRSVLMTQIDDVAYVMAALGTSIPLPLSFFHRVFWRFCRC